MNQKKAKALRKMARFEMAEHGVERELVQGLKPGQAINAPNSTRAMHRALKKAYKNQARTAL